MTRRLTAAVAALAMLLILAVPVAAGGWAEIVADAQTTTETPPVEGQPIDIGFLVLQHGMTPAGWETATVHFTNASTGKTMDVVATNDRPDGHFLATATLPEAGSWTWQVTLKDLASEHAPVALTVEAATGQVAASGPLSAIVPLAILAVVTAAFAVFWRTRRSRPTVKVSPAPRGVDPA